VQPQLTVLFEIETGLSQQEFPISGSDLCVRETEAENRQNHSVTFSSTLGVKILE
jgi:hypothetical protein